MFYMHKEIYEEPKAIINTLEELERYIKDIANVIKKYERIYVIGSGTSYHASLYFELLFPNSIAIHASEFIKRKISIDNNTLVVAISQSGESKDVIDSVMYAKKLGGKILGVTNTFNSTLYRLSDERILTKAGEEKAIAATKSYIAQLTAIAYLFSYYIGDEELRKQILNLPNKIYDIFAMEGLYKKYGETLNEKVIVLGSGILYPTALESSLKLRETANLLSEAFPIREFLHGYLQTLDSKTDIIILGDSSDERQVVKKLIQYSRVIRICESCDISVPSIIDLLKPIIYIIPVQFIAFYKALKKGLNPDKPEKLVKVVKE